MAMARVGIVAIVAFAFVAPQRVEANPVFAAAIKAVAKKFVSKTIQSSFRKRLRNNLRRRIQRRMFRRGRRYRLRRMQNKQRQQLVSLRRLQQRKRRRANSKPGAISATDGGFGRHKSVHGARFVRGWRNLWRRFSGPRPGRARTLGSTGSFGSTNRRGSPFRK